MPKTEDKFNTVIDRRKSATVIRKGSKAGKEFEAERSGTMDYYQEGDKRRGTRLAKEQPATNNRINKSAARHFAANQLTENIRKADKERTKYAKGGKV